MIQERAMRATYPGLSFIGYPMALTVFPRYCHQRPSIFPRPDYYYYIINFYTATICQRKAFRCGLLINSIQIARVMSLGVSRIT